MPSRLAENVVLVKILLIPTHDGLLLLASDLGRVHNCPAKTSLALAVDE